MLFLVLVSASGLLLNHADGLGLSHHAAAPWLLRLYGDELPPVDSAYSSAGVLFASSSSSLFAGDRMLANGIGSLVGVVAAGGLHIVATARELLVANSDIELIERYTTDLPDEIEQLGTNGQIIVVATRERMYELDPLAMSLSVADSLSADDVLWSQPTTPGAEQAERIGAAVLGEAISWERVLLDFHSGRILPTFGRYLADLTAICILYMCFTGIFVWVRKR